MYKIISKIENCKLKIGNSNRGMTYVELIVVLGIFSLMSSIMIFNYGAFQSKVDIKNLANDVAIKIVEAQRAANFGILPSGAVGSDWKPSYGVHFDIDADNKRFIYFVDLANLGIYDGGSELLEQINITKGNFIDRIDIYNGITAVTPNPTSMTITFTRPSQEATFYSGNNPIALVGSSGNY